MKYNICEEEVSFRLFFDSGLISITSDPIKVSFLFVCVSSWPQREGDLEFYANLR